MQLNLFNLTVQTILDSGRDNYCQSVFVQSYKRLLIRQLKATSILKITKLLSCIKLQYNLKILKCFSKLTQLETDKKSEIYKTSKNILESAISVKIKRGLPHVQKFSFSLGFSSGSLKRRRK